MNNTETPGTATVKYKHSANRSNIKYQGWDTDGLKEFSNIASLIKLQRNQQCRRQLEQNYKNHVQNKLNCKYGIITATPSESIESYIVHNDLSSDDDEPVSTAQNQATNANHNIVELDNNKRDMLKEKLKIK